MFKLKLPTRVRHLTRATIGLRGAESIDPEELQTLAASQRVLLIGIGNVSAGTTDARHPGEQRTASLLGLAAAVADVPKDRVIVTHCG